MAVASPAPKAANPTKCFTPARVLAGSSVTGFVRWQGVKAKGIALTAVPSLPIVEAYNGDISSKLSDGPHQIALNGPQGYIGFMLNTKALPNTVNEVRIEVLLLYESGTRETFQRTVVIYRPRLKLEKAPAAMKLKVREGGIEMRPRIVVQNHGVGTAIVSMHAKDAPGLVNVKRAGWLEDFRQGFTKDVDSKMAAIREKHPTHAEILSKMPGIFFLVRHAADVDRMRELDEYMLELARKMNADEGFANDLTDAIVWAFSRNYKAEFQNEQFIEYMNSIGSAKVHLFNPMDVVPLSVGRNSIKFHLSQTDLARNQRPDLEINEIVVESEIAIEVPVHNFFWFEEVVDDE